MSICPSDHKHGLNTTCRSEHHCKCDDCREHAREYEYWREGHIRAGRPLLVDATGTIRRMRALRRLGWSSAAIAKRAGRSKQWAQGLTRNRKVSRATAKTIRTLCDELSMSIPPARTRGELASMVRARKHAERQGWPAPLAWDDDTIDDPAAMPSGVKEAA